MKREMVVATNCIICRAVLSAANRITCTACGKACKAITEFPDPPPPDGTMDLLHAFSDCCDADIVFNARATCSTICHDRLVALAEEQFGRFKEVVDTATGRSHRVPTRVIIERGVNQKDLHDYPLWEA